MIKDLPKTTTNFTTADTTYTDVIDMGGKALDEIESTVHVTDVTGTAFTLDVILQYSYDKETWFDAEIAFRFTQITDATTADTAETLEYSRGLYVRFKYVVAGANIDVTIDHYAVGKSK